MKDCVALILPAHGNITYDTLSLGGTATYVCDVGYELIDYTDVICGYQEGNLTGTWSISTSSPPFCRSMYGRSRVSQQTPVERRVRLCA